MYASCIIFKRIGIIIVFLYLKKIKNIFLNVDILLHKGPLAYLLTKNLLNRESHNNFSCHKVKIMYA